jgi:hypothetical protein
MPAHAGGRATVSQTASKTAKQQVPSGIRRAALCVPACALGRWRWAHTTQTRGRTGPDGQLPRVARVPVSPCGPWDA